MIFGESSSVQNRTGQQLAGSGVMFDCNYGFTDTRGNARLRNPPAQRSSRLDLIFDAQSRGENVRGRLVAVFAGWGFCRLMKLTTNFSRKFWRRRATCLWRDVVVRILGFT